jgi:hypothetical protein
MPWLSRGSDRGVADGEFESGARPVGAHGVKMRFAFVNNERREPERTGERGYCDHCKGGVYSAVGEFVARHWKHFGGDCDDWPHESETPWHRAWKALVPVGMQEVSIVRGNEHHRADIFIPHYSVARRPRAEWSRGRVIELQHSSIAPCDVRARSAFYGRMIWLFHGRQFVSNLVSAKFRRASEANYIGDPSLLSRYDEVELIWKRASRVVAIAMQYSPVYLDLGVAFPGQFEPDGEAAEAIDRMLAGSCIDIPSDTLMLRLTDYRKDSAGTFIRAEPLTREAFMRKHMRQALVPFARAQVDQEAGRRIIAIGEYRERRRRAAIDSAAIEPWIESPAPSRDEAPARALLRLMPLAPTTKRRHKRSARGQVSFASRLETLDERNERLRQKAEREARLQREEERCHQREALRLSSDDEQVKWQSEVERIEQSALEDAIGEKSGVELKEQLRRATRLADEVHLRLKAQLHVGEAVDPNDEEALRAAYRLRGEARRALKARSMSEDESP